MDFYAELKRIYHSLPTLECGSCWGECCVSPTMTAPEFILMLNHAKEIFSEQELSHFLMQNAREHKFWEGNHYCRFQHAENGRCQVYEGRALACRLHGHEALRAYENPDMVFCDKDPDPKRNLSKEALEGHLGSMRDILEHLPTKFEAPWFMSSMNLECWLDFYFDESIALGRIELEALHKFLHQELQLPRLNRFSTTTLKGKINWIEKFWNQVQVENWSEAAKSLITIREDFPSTGSYFLEECDYLSEWIGEREFLAQN